MPVHKIANNLGTREISKVSNWDISPLSNPVTDTSKTPKNKDAIEKTNKSTANVIVNVCFLIWKPPLK